MKRKVLTPEQVAARRAKRAAVAKARRAQQLMLFQCSAYSYRIDYVREAVRRAKAPHKFKCNGVKVPRRVHELLDHWSRMPHTPPPPAHLRLGSTAAYPHSAAVTGRLYQRYVTALVALGMSPRTEGQWKALLTTRDLMTPLGFLEAAYALAVSEGLMQEEPIT